MYNFIIKDSVRKFVEICMGETQFLLFLLFLFIFYFFNNGILHGFISSF